MSWIDDPRDVEKRPVDADDIRTMRPKHRLNSIIWRRYKVTHAALLALDFVLTKTAKWPGVEVWHPLVKPKNNHWFNIPANVEVRQPRTGEVAIGKPGRSETTAPQVVKLGLDFSDKLEKFENVPLAAQVCYALIDASEYIYIKDTCCCRHGRDCQKHDHTIGCMFLGASGLDSVPDGTRRASKEEAYAHVQRGLADGLVPMAGRFRVDNYGFFLPDNRTLLGLCMCCNCCCYMQSYRKMPSEVYDQICYKLPGTALYVDSAKCIGCGKCVDICYIDAISLENGICTTHDTCRACGRCVGECPTLARSLVCTDPDYATKAANELLGRADLSVAPNRKSHAAVRDMRAPRGQWALSEMLEQKR